MKATRHTQGPNSWAPDPHDILSGSLLLHSPQPKDTFFFPIHASHPRRQFFFKVFWHPFGPQLHSILSSLQVFLLNPWWYLVILFYPPFLFVFVVLTLFFSVQYYTRRSFKLNTVFLVSSSLTHTHQQTNTQQPECLHRRCQGPAGQLHHYSVTHTYTGVRARVTLSHNKQQKQVVCIQRLQRKGYTSHYTYCHLKRWRCLLMVVGYVVQNL